MLYVDTSAVVKLLRREAESDAIAASLRGAELFASGLLVTELIRAIRRHGPVDHERIASVLGRISLVRITPSRLHASAWLGDASVRSLDAIHLATALELREQLKGFVSYDVRQLAAASALGLPVLSPGCAA